MPMPAFVPPTVCVVALLVATAAPAQDLPPSLDLQSAVRIALERNGLVGASRFDSDAARARVIQARASYFPSIVQSYDYTDNVANDYGLEGTFASRSYRQTNLSLNVSWTLLDSGQRKTSFDRANTAYAAARLEERQQRRNIIYETTSGFYEALRGQELVRVAEAQVQRAKTILEITRARVEEGDTAAKEILQAEADLANAEVSLIQARIRAGTSESSLKAVMGIPEDRTLPPLEAPPAPSVPAQLPPLDTYEQSALSQRPDLLAQEQNLRSLRLAVQQAQLDQRITFELSAGYSRRWETQAGDNRRLTLMASIPIFDAGLRRENVRASVASEESARLRYVQQQRTVRAEVESGYLELTLRASALRAAEVALRAARVNYEAAEEARRLGAASLSEVINAQLALVTAETNSVQAVYDYYVADSRLALISGQAMIGETP
ncbi:MAG: TolC family protein [Fimbriimonadia bacterium]